jgi:hypothetical protein
MTVLEEPVPAPTERLLRSAVLDLATERRRRVPPVLHVGAPGSWMTVPDDRTWDHGLRTDLVGAALRRLDRPEAVAWVTRSGPLTMQDVDAAWLAPVVTAGAERDMDVTFVVVTRHGWVDPRSGVRRVWRRIRQR